MISPHAVIHAKALVDQGAAVGPRTRVWAFAHLVSGAVVGEDCNICDHTFIEGGVCLGNRVTVKCGNFLWEGVSAEDDVFIGPCVAFTNDLRPRSRRYPESYLTTTLKRGCSIGANATILPGLTIGRWAMIGAGTVVTKDVPDFALVVGNPGRRQGWVCRCGENLGAVNRGLALCECGRVFKIENNFATEMETHLRIHDFSSRIGVVKLLQ